MQPGVPTDRTQGVSAQQEQQGSKIQMENSRKGLTCRITLDPSLLEVTSPVMHVMLGQVKEIRV